MNRPGMAAAVGETVTDRGWMADTDSSVCCNGRLQHSELMLQGLDELRRHGLLCDVTLHVGTLCLPAHRAVLASCSPYFRAMFTTELVECHKDIVDLREVHPAAFSLILQYAYTGEIRVDDTNVQELLPAACLLQVEKVISRCCDYLESQLDPSNCIGIAKFAETHSCIALQRRCLLFQRQHFAEVARHQEFLQLSDPNEIIDTISKDDILVSSEMDVFEAIQSWIVQDAANRGPQLLKLMSHLRFPHLPLTFLRGLLGNALIKSQSTDHQLSIEGTIKTVIEYKTQSSLRLQRVFDAKYEDILNAQPRQPASILCVAGGTTGHFVTLNSSSMYEPDSNTWHHLQPLPISRFESGSASLGGRIYVIGGMTRDADDDGGAHHRVAAVTYWSRDGGDTWRDAVPLQQSRSTLAVVAQGGYLYALGGYDGNSYLRMVERYRPGGTCWERRADMLQGRSCFCAAALEETVYALGGYGPPCLNRLVSDNTPVPTNNPLATMGLDSVERYDPVLDSWTNVASMSEKRINFGAASLCGFLFVVGGHSGVAYLSSCERYDPITDQWTTVKGMGQPRSGLGVAVIGRHMYAVGGISCALSQKTVQRYDPQTDTWCQLEDMDCSRSSFAIAAL